MDMLNFELTNTEKQTLDGLKAKLADIEQEIETLHRTQLTGTQTNPEASIGGIRSRSKKEKRRIFERFTREAKQSVDLHKQRDILRNMVANMERLPEVRRARFHKNIELYMWWDNIKAGDTIDIGGNMPLTVKKKNKRSIVTVGGSKWTIFEITGIYREELPDIEQFVKGGGNAS